jgi:hypothetical protein
MSIKIPEKWKEPEYDIKLMLIMFLWLLHYVDMGDVADVSNVYAASIFRVFFLLPRPCGNLHSTHGDLHNARLTA